MNTIPSSALTDNGKYSGIFINCPVDITVRANNTLILQIINDEIIVYEDSPIQAMIDSDGQKIISVPGDVQASIEIVATGDGEFNYTVEEITHEEGVVRTLNYAPVTIREGNSLTGTVSAEDGTGYVEYHLYDEAEEVPIETALSGTEADKLYLINVEVVGEGSVTEGAYKRIGEFIQVEATPAENAIFKGWYKGATTLLSTETTYRHKVIGETTLTAVFTPQPTINLSAKEIKLFPGASQRIFVSGLIPDDRVYFWRTGDPNVASLFDGTISGISISANNPGSTIITVALRSGLTADVKVTVLKPTLKLSETSVTVDVGKTHKVTANNLAEGDKPMSWKSANPSIATVNNKGLITGINAGTTKVTVTLLSGLTATISVTVKDLLQQPKLIAAYNGAHGIGVKFIKVNNADSYVIYQKFNGVWSKIKTVKANSSELQVEGNKLMYTDKTVAKLYGKGYIYSVEAKKGSLVSGYNKTGVAIYRLYPPTISTAVNSAAGTATVSWKGVFGKTETNGNYDLQIAEYSNGKAGTFNSVITKPGYKFNVLKTTVKGLKKGKTYVFRIRCSKTNKDRGTFYSEYSPWLSVSITR